MSFPRALNAAQDEEFIELWNDGAGYIELCDRFGITGGTVSRTAARLGLDRRYRRHTRPGIQVTQRDGFARDWRAGTPVRELAEKYGVSTGTISTTAQRFGLPRRLPLYARRSKRISPGVLGGGQWVPSGGILVWREADAS